MVPGTAAGKRTARFGSLRAETNWRASLKRNNTPIIITTVHDSIRNAVATMAIGKKIIFRWKIPTSNKRETRVEKIICDPSLPAAAAHPSGEPHIRTPLATVADCRAAGLRLPAVSGLLKRSVVFKKLILILEREKKNMPTVIFCTSQQKLISFFFFFATQTYTKDTRTQLSRPLRL